MIGLNENSDDVQWEKAISNLLLLPYPYPALTSEDFLNIRQKYFQGADFSDPNDIIWRQAEVNPKLLQDSSSFVLTLIIIDYFFKILTVSIGWKF